MKINLNIPNNIQKEIGFKISDSSYDFYFPRNYMDLNSSEEKKKKEAVLLFNLIEQHHNTNDEIDNLDGKCHIFFAMCWLINDYKTRGIYIETERKYSFNGNGKINWKKTIRNNEILVDNNFNIIYRRFVKSVNRVNDDYLLTEIYKMCLNYSIQLIGYFFDVKDTVHSNLHYDEKHENKEMYLMFLRKEVNNTFNDYKKLLIKNLITIIDESTTSGGIEKYLISTSEFEYIFERMVDKVFGNKKVEDFYNKYHYMINGEPKNANSKTRPDTILETDDHIYVIDSKYYQYGYTNDVNNLPGAAAIAKQISYNQYLKNKDDLKNKDGIGNKEVSSIFLLPFLKQDNGPILECVGYAYGDNEGNKEDKIPVVLVDLRTLIHNYLSPKDNLRGELLNTIKRTMKKYYLAYGSNLNLNQMKHRCPSASKVGTYYLKGYSLEFRCYLTIVKDENGVVPLGIFELDDEEERYLDRYEGYPILYRKETFKVKLDNKEIEALIYIMNDDQYPKIKPFKPYIDTCLEGYKDFGFDYKYLLEALEEFK